MGDRWDFYFARVDDRVASIYLDLGIAEEAPLAQFPTMAYVRVPMREPRGDGLSSDHEYPALIAMEDQLVPALCADARVRFVGRNTTAGCRDFFFYLQAGVDWQQAVAQAMADVVDYDYEAGEHADPQWRSYFEFLYPDAEGLESIGNRGVCASLDRQGDVADVPRLIRHWAYFGTPQACERYLEQVRALGFALVERRQGKQGGWLVLVEREDTVQPERIDLVCLPLFRLAQQCDGRYDGWESPVMRAATP